MFAPNGAEQFFALAERAGRKLRDMGLLGPEAAAKFWHANGRKAYRFAAG